MINYPSDLDPNRSHPQQPHAPPPLRPIIEDNFNDNMSNSNYSFEPGLLNSNFVEGDNPNNLQLQGNANLNLIPMPVENQNRAFSDLQQNH